MRFKTVELAVNELLSHELIHAEEISGHIKEYVLVPPEIRSEEMHARVRFDCELGRNEEERMKFIKGKLSHVLAERLMDVLEIEVKKYNSYGIAQVNLVIEDLNKLEKSE